MDTENQKTNTAIADAENQELNTDAADIAGTDTAGADIEKEKDREEALRKAKERAEKRRLIPPFVMLLAGAIVSIAMFIWHYKSKDMLIILLCVLVAFYIAGEIFKWMLDHFEAQIEKARMEEGEVIEKELDEVDSM